MNQYVITGTKTYTYYKTVYAENLVDAHIKAHERSEDSDDDWTCYFDDDYDHDCGKCDNCCGGREMRLEGTTEQDVTEHVRMFVGLCQSMDQQYGKTTWIDTLRGSKAKKMTTALRSNPYYNKGSGHSVAWWKELVEIMLAKGILRDECLGGRFNANVIKPTMEGLNWYYTGENEATFALDSVSMKTTS